MLLIFPIILCSNSRRYHPLCFAFLPIILESMIDINVLKKSHNVIDSVRKSAGTSIDPVKKALEIVLSKSNVGIDLEVVELQATELELSSAMLSLLPLT